MSKLLLTTLSLFCTLALSACGSGVGSGGGGGNRNTIAVTPANLGCINGSATCASETYSTYSGWTNYAMPYGNTGYNYTGYFNQYGFCGCPAGYSPAYNGTMGLGCIGNQYLYPYYNYTMFMSFGAAFGGGATINIPQVSNIPNTAYQGNCARQLTQSCLVNQANSCGTGATCQQVLTGSSLGVCINPYQTFQNYGTAYGPNYGYGNNFGAGAGFGFRVYGGW